MSKLVTPQTYLVGYTCLDTQGITEYLNNTGQEGFLEEIEQAIKEGLSQGEILCSFYAKLCYASLVLGKNENISKTRSIYDNILGTIKSGHGSVFEHCSLNFVTTGCSRIYTHEQVRHRVGSAYSQTSGRYVRTDEISFVHDPILDDCKDLIQDALDYLEKTYKAMEERKAINYIKDFAIKKKITSAMRRILPNGQGNELGHSVNLRGLRHTIVQRTSRHAEWEIRLIYNQIYDLVNNKYPAIFADSKKELVDGLMEVTFENEKI